MTLERWNEDARKVAEIALREALSIGHNYIGPEHILLALLRTDTKARRALESLADHNEIRNAVIGTLSSPTLEQRVAALENHIHSKSEAA